ncbi:amidohydrolase family protein [Faecalicatena sp. BF-R-105]|nr:amidohydrolase family protein [Faecalicatena sp. BF-R-105]
MNADLMIRKGRILDPAEKIDFIGDIAVKSGKIVAIAPEIQAEGAREILAQGCLVTAGLIDSHCHIYEGGTWNGMPADLGGIPMGVTAMIDAGSTGVSNYQNLIRQLRHSKIHGKIMLNISACGIIMPTQFNEPVNPELWNLELFDNAFQEYGNDIVGLKLRANKEVLKGLGLDPVKRTVELAERYHTKVIVHVTDAPETMGNVADILRAGDIFCHVYHGTGHTILSENGSIEEKVYTARKRGVIFDAAPGRGNFSLAVAQAAMKQGFYPDIISTDVTLQNWHNPIAGNLPLVMSRFLALGMPVENIISCVTSVPTDAYHLADGLGTLQVGTAADLSILKLENTNREFRDRFGNSIMGSHCFIPKATIIAGKIVYRAADLNIAFEG